MKLTRPITPEVRAELKTHKALINQLIQAWREKDSALIKLNCDMDDANALIGEMDGRIDLAADEESKLARAERAAKILPGEVIKAEKNMALANRDLSRKIHAAFAFVKAVAFEQLLKQLTADFVERTRPYFKDEFTAAVLVKQTEAHRLLVHSFTYPESSGNFLERTLADIDALLENRDIFNPFLTAVK